MRQKIVLLNKFSEKSTTNLNALSGAVIENSLRAEDHLEMFHLVELHVAKFSSLASAEWFLFSRCLRLLVVVVLHFDEAEAAVVRNRDEAPDDRHRLQGPVEVERPVNLEAE